MASGADTRKLEVHTDWVKSVAISPDNKSIVTGSDDKTVRCTAGEEGREGLQPQAQPQAASCKQAPTEESKAQKADTGAGGAFPIFYVY
jgi:hypothetical protein